MTSAHPTQSFFFFGAVCLLCATRSGVSEVRRATHPIDDQMQHVASGNTPLLTEGAQEGLPNFTEN